MRIVIAEDDALLREGLVLLLRSEGFDVVAAVDHPGDLVASVETAEPDLAVVDVRMPPTFTDEGLRAALEARRRAPGLAILALSAFVEDGYAGDLLAAGGRRRRLPAQGAGRPAGRVPRRPEARGRRRHGAGPRRRRRPAGPAAGPATPSRR